MEDHRNAEMFYTHFVSELHVKIHTVYTVIAGIGKLPLVSGGGGRRRWKQHVPCNVVAHFLIPASLSLSLSLSPPPTTIFLCNSVYF
jgi:hypothetical protein